MTDTPKGLAVVERGEITDGMHPLVRAILAHNPTPDALEKMMALQREHEANEARKRYAQALVDLKRDLPTKIGRDTTVDFTGKSGIRTYYKHTSLAAVMDAITEPLTKHGFSLAWTPSTGERGVTVTCRLTHAAGHFEEAAITAPRDDSGNKSQAQGVASTITLLSRYTALALLGIATADMPEPAGEAEPPDPSRVDTDRNMRAVAALKKYGKTRADAEAFLGHTIAGWTSEDLDKLKAWLKPAPEAA